LHQPPAFRAGTREIPALLDASGARQAQGTLRRGRHVGAGSDGRQALAPDPAAVPQRGSATAGGFARQKTMLPFAANLRRLILSFHSQPIRSAASMAPQPRSRATRPRIRRPLEAPGLAGAARLSMKTKVSSAAPGFVGTHGLPDMRDGGAVGKSRSECAEPNAIETTGGSGGSGGARTRNLCRDRAAL
jgi:hypothetical protein